MQIAVDHKLAPREDFSAEPWTQDDDQIDNAFGGTEFFDEPGNRWDAIEQ